MNFELRILNEGYEDNGKLWIGYYGFRICRLWRLCI